MQVQDLKNFISEKKPNLAKSSVNTYASILRSLHSKIWGGSIDPARFKNTEQVIEHLGDVPPNRRKTILSALVSITDKKPYKDLMMEDVRDYNSDIAEQTKTPAQRESWVDTSQVQALHASLKKDADSLYRKERLTKGDLQAIQSYIIVALLGGIYIPPRRSKDYVDFRIRGDIDQDSDNYMRGKKFVFNSYKTAKTYGRQEVDIPPALKSILTKWIKANPTEHLLFDTNGNKLSSVKLNQRLNRIFDGKKVGVNQLRHTFLTDKYKKTSEESRALSEDMAQMGSSRAMADTYIKLK